MDLVPWNPMREFDRLRATMDRLLSDSLLNLGMGNLQMRFPIEVIDRGAEVVVRAELAGIDPKDVEVRITDEGVTLRGERKLETDQDRAGIRHTERFYGSFARSVSFPAPVDSAQARATFRHGVLEVRAPKRQPSDGRDGRRLNIETH